jgi:hypothetical protein
VRRLQLAAALTVSRRHRVPPAAAAIPEGASSASPLGVSHRFLRHHHVLCCGELGDDAMNAVFQGMVVASVQHARSRETLLDCTGVATGLYRRVRAMLLPVPAKPHYAFSPHHLTRALHAACEQVQRRASSGSELAAREAGVLFAHECMRCVGDALLDDAQLAWLRATVAELMAPLKAPTGGDRLTPRDVLRGAGLMDGSLLFCGFLGTSTATEEAARVYRPVAGAEETVAAALERHLAEHNSLFKKAPLRVVTFAAAATHTALLVRLLERDYGGHILQVGSAGCGRRTLTALASFVARSKLFTVEMRPEYSRTKWREDLKEALQHAGAQGRRTTLLLVDSPLFPRAVLDDVAHLVKNGHVPGLFLGDDHLAMMDNQGAAEMVQGAADGGGGSPRSVPPVAPEPGGGAEAPRTGEAAKHQFARRTQQHLRVRASGSLGGNSDASASRLWARTACTCDLQRCLLTLSRHPLNPCPRREVVELTGTYP